VFRIETVGNTLNEPGARFRARRLCCSCLPWLPKDRCIVWEIHALVPIRSRVASGNSETSCV